ncbi:NADPH-dependent FMN reductase [Marinomonas gallaica]|uniref:NADPH-dependent FMN reductase n=1 Tax=Marinomonas gallaica TaxID=1806667 RepID=A0A1C3JNQ2_9GAMM|nr:NAD(P)H-dependent oxidoreductase [Marinomonas gallaica]SBT16689.1 NADPH-dependent FMN reductase [Marinomonas gallaica]SBT20405.1 NADPH-dependent FMN reductase [Marinomonas gallaica]
MKVLAFAATNHKASINKQLVTYAANVLAENKGADVEVLDLNDYELPIYSIERQTENGMHPLAQQFFDKIGAADVVLISFAEHNGSYSAVYKNLFDWTSRIDMKVYQNKPTVLLSTSPGPGGANSVLSAAVGSAEFFAMDLKGSLSVPSFNDNFDTDKGVLTNAELTAKLKDILSKVE